MSSLPPTSSTSATLDLQTCTAAELAAYLRQHRFDCNNATTTTTTTKATAIDEPIHKTSPSSSPSCAPSSFLGDKGTRTFLQAALDFLDTTTKMKGTTDDEPTTNQETTTTTDMTTTTTTSNLLGAPWSESDVPPSFLRDVTCCVPRCGKIQLQLYEHGLQAVKASGSTTNNKKMEASLVASAAPASTVADAATTPLPVVWTLLSHLASTAVPTTTTMDNAAAAAIQRILVVPKPDDLKQKRARVSQVILLVSDAPAPDAGKGNHSKNGGSSSSGSRHALITFKEKSYSHVCWIVTPPAPPKKSKANDNANNNNTPVMVTQEQFDGALESFLHLLSRAVGGAPVTRIPTATTELTTSFSSFSSNGEAFTSFVDPRQSTTTAGLPFVSCYHGTRDGVLYPLEQGLLFAGAGTGHWQYFPRQHLYSLAAGRGCGGNSRFVDLVVTLHKQSKNNGNSRSTTTGDDDDDHTDDGGGEIVEFTNIDRVELTGLNRYIHGVLIPALQRDAANATSTTQREQEEDDNEDRRDPNEADPELDPENALALATENDIEDGVAKHVVPMTDHGRCRPKRKASQDAQDAIRRQPRRSTLDNPSTHAMDDDDDDEDDDPDFNLTNPDGHLENNDDDDDDEDDDAGSAMEDDDDDEDDDAEDEEEDVEAIVVVTTDDTEEELE